MTIEYAKCAGFLLRMDLSAVVSRKMCMVTSAMYTVSDILPIASGEYEEVELRRQTPIHEKLIV